jgi:hypothetical protein
MTDRYFASEERVEERISLKDDGSAAGLGRELALIF